MTDRDQYWNNLPEWLLKHQNQFEPPVSIQTMFNHQLTMIFLKGPNSRQDFHIEEGEEIFYMIEGEMNLKVIDNNKFRNINIKAGEIFVLPARIRHSPRRPANSLGYVIERKRFKDSEFDGLLFYNENIEEQMLEPIHEVYGYVGDDFEGDVKFMVSTAIHAIKIGNISSKSTNSVKRLVKPDEYIKIPDPVSIEAFILNNEKTISNGGILPIFPSLVQSKIELLAEGEFPCIENTNDIIIWIYKGSATIKQEDEVNSSIVELRTNDFYLLKAEMKLKSTLIVKSNNLAIRLRMARK